MTKSNTLLHRVSDMYVVQKQFTADDGRTIDYERLVIEFHVKNQLQQIEVKLSPDKMQMLELADEVNNDTILDDK